MSCPLDHESARFVGYRPETVASLIGAIDSERAYYTAAIARGGNEEGGILRAVAFPWADAGPPDTTFFICGAELCVLRSDEFTPSGRRSGLMSAGWTLRPPNLDYF